MKDVLDKLDQWREKKSEFAITTVIETWGSAPRPVGSKMVTTRTGQIAGSVSAGCVEGAVIQESEVVMDTGQPRLVEFGVADDEAWEVGLACGGQIKVFIEPGFALDGIFDSLKENIEKGERFSTLTILKGLESSVNKKLLMKSDGQVIGDLAITENDQGDGEILRLLESDVSGVSTLPDGSSIFVEVYPRPAKLIIVGAVHLSDPLITMANAVGFETILIDPREAFATRERFPHVDQLICQWPQDVLQSLDLDNSSFVVILTHDPKLDDPALQLSLGSEAGYIGALGSRRTNKKRVERLRKAGMTEAQISRLHAPVGLPLGGRSPGEIAVSIMAEIVKVNNQ
jgi:xanthine dehydrogenase accessory factor